MASVVRNPKARSKSLSREGQGKAAKARPRPKAGPATKRTARAKPASRSAAPIKAAIQPKAGVRPERSEPKGGLKGKAMPPLVSAAPAAKPAAPPSAAALNEKKKKKKSAGRRKAQRTAADMVAGMSLHRLSHLAATDWEDLMAMADMDGVRPYAMKGQFHRGEVIQHKVFGLGIVVREIGTEKIQVSFRDGVRLLVCNRQR